MGSSLVAVVNSQVTTILCTDYRHRSRLLVGPQAERHTFEAHLMTRLLLPEAAANAARPT